MDRRLVTAHCNLTRTGEPIRPWGLAEFFDQHSQRVRTYFKQHYVARQKPNPLFEIVIDSPDHDSVARTVELLGEAIADIYPVASTRVHNCSFGHYNINTKG